jgi:hypothetical protein
MKTHMLTFFGGNPALRYSNLDETAEEERRKHVLEWSDWIAGLAKAGILQTGHPYETHGKRIDSSGIHDYQFPEESAGGFIIVKTDSADDAARIATTSPIIRSGGYVLVRPCGELSK